jgi:hypothetical protein
MAEHYHCNTELNCPERSEFLINPVKGETILFHRHQKNSYVFENKKDVFHQPDDAERTWLP